MTLHSYTTHRRKAAQRMRAWYAIVRIWRVVKTSSPGDAPLRERLQLLSEARDAVDRAHHHIARLKQCGRVLKDHFLFTNPTPQMKTNPYTHTNALDWTPEITYDAKGGSSLSALHRLRDATRTNPLAVLLLENFLHDLNIRSATWNASRFQGRKESPVEVLEPSYEESRRVLEIRTGPLVGFLTECVDKLTGATLRTSDLWVRWLALEKTLQPAPIQAREEPPQLSKAAAQPSEPAAHLSEPAPPALPGFDPSQLTQWLAGLQAKASRIKKFEEDRDFLLAAKKKYATALQELAGKRAALEEQATGYENELAKAQERLATIDRELTGLEADKQAIAVLSRFAPPATH